MDQVNWRKGKDRFRLGTNALDWTFRLYLIQTASLFPKDKDSEWGLRKYEKCREKILYIAVETVVESIIHKIFIRTDVFLKAVDDTDLYVKLETVIMAQNTYILAPGKQPWL